jgi:UDP-glucose 4-epimerase
MDTVLVTGGAGFIGSHLVDAIAENGYQVVVIDDLSTGTKDNLRNPDITFYEGSIENASFVNDVFARHKPETVFHLAAQISVSRSVREPALDAGINIVGSIRIMEACVRFGTKKLIFTSSGGVMYGENPPVFPTPEEVPLIPGSPYGLAKLTGESYLSFFTKEYGLNWTALRYANVFGPRQNPHGEAGVVAIFLKKMLANHPVIINGDGEYIRDYVYVRDVVKANILAMKTGDRISFNIGTGKGLSVNELFLALQKAVGYPQKPQYGPARPGDLRKSILDSGKAKRFLGWEPEYTLEQGLSETVRYFKEQAGRM